MTGNGPISSGLDDGASRREAGHPRVRIAAVGASAGGLDAFRRFVAAIPPASGIAYLLVQHLDPHHPSRIVELIADHATIPACEAANGMIVAPDHIYVIPPRAFLSVVDGVLHVTAPGPTQSARLPFDVLLNSLAEGYGPRAAAITLTGTGSDGALGSLNLKARGGRILVQAPEEAEYPGMPASVIASGCADQVLPVAEIPGALAGHWTAAPQVPDGTAAPGDAEAVIDFLRSRTDMDFSVYKPGTIRRRIARRIGLMGLAPDDFAGYLARLGGDDAELALLASDLLINVTAFFRDPEVFDALAAETIPDIIAAHAGDGPIRIWVAGCSTGQEAYSLAMLFVEGLQAAGSRAGLQIFASDIDEDAIAQARAGLYPASLEAEVTPARLQTFFVRERDGYRVSARLRSLVIFSVQDLLKDPPFSRLDLVSCRNLLIYLGPEAQARALSLFHFALRPEGVLLLGGAETPAHNETKFTVLSKALRTYRRSARSAALDHAEPLAGVRNGVAPSAAPLAADRQDRLTRMAEFSRSLILAQYGPPTILINSEMECLHSVGDLDPYLRVPPGDPTRSLLELARAPFAPTLRAAIHLAQRDQTRVSLAVTGASQSPLDRQTVIEATPVRVDGAALILVSFIDQPAPPAPAPGAPLTEAGRAAVAQELELTRLQLQAALLDLDVAATERKIVSEESQSIQEEYQSANEELRTSKEELQSLNEELTALNTQLQESLEQQRGASSDLQNVLYSTNVATLFLDRKLQIRFYTPATTALFHLIPSDLGRPLADLKGVADDPSLLDDARRVLETQSTVEQEFAVSGAQWFRRRIFPYIAADSGISGVVITFADVTGQHQAAAAVDLARHGAERANLAKSRFLAAASHDLRQPLQTLALLQGLLAKTVTEEGPQRLIRRFDETLSAMSGMLNTLLDINQIEAGDIRPVRADIAVGDVLSLIKDEFTYHGLAKRLTLRVAPSSTWVSTDPRLLEQILRNLVSNALKYTSSGKVLVGCRRRGDRLRIEVWDTGVGIPEADHAAIFDEYHQLDNDARERSKGMGLGLAIVQQLAGLLGHPITVRSTPGKGSMFAIDVPRASQPSEARGLAVAARPAARTATAPRSGALLVVEDDPELRELLIQVLSADGHRVLAAASGPDALAAVQSAAFHPDLILADYNLPGGMDGLEASQQLNRLNPSPAPVIVLTGDISTRAQLAFETGGAIRLSKPVKTDLLRETIQRILGDAGPPTGRRGAALPPPLPAPGPDRSPVVRPPPATDAPLVYIVDDDALLRDSLREVLEADGRTVMDFGAGEDFLDGVTPHREACLLLDAYLPGMNGLELLQRLSEAGRSLPTIVITGHGDIHMAVDAMKAGAIDFIQKPVSHDDLVDCIDRALERSRDTNRASEWRDDAIRHIHTLTTRQREVMDLVLAGHPSKNIAADLGISQRTVENHRASIMKRTGARSLPALARLAVAAALSPKTPGGA